MAAASGVPPSVPPASQQVMSRPSPSAYEALKQRISELWKQSLATAEGKDSTAGESSALTAALRNLPVSLFPKVPRVVEIPSTASLAEAISVLEHHNFRCLPVRNPDKPEGASWTEGYAGILDYPGIMLWTFLALGAGPETVNQEFKNASPALLGLASSTAKSLYGQFEEGALPVKKPEEESGKEAMGADRTRFRDEILMNSIFQDNKVGDAVGWFPGVSTFDPVNEKESVLSVLDRMAQGGVRLVPVVPDEGKDILNVITPMGVLDFLTQCSGLPWFDNIAQKPLSDLGLPLKGPDDIFKVEEGDLLMEPFRLMLEQRISGVPVVAPHPDKTGSFEVVANISSTDMGHLLHCPHLFTGQKDPGLLRVADLLNAVEADSALGGKRDFLGPTMKPPICCRTDDTLVHVMQAMRRARIRRVYVTQEDKSLAGVVTLRDVLSLFASPMDSARPSQTASVGA